MCVMAWKAKNAGDSSALKPLACSHCSQGKERTGPYRLPAAEMACQNSLSFWRAPSTPLAAIP